MNKGKDGDKDKKPVHNQDKEDNLLVHLTRSIWFKLILVFTLLYAFCIVVFEVLPSFNIGVRSNWDWLSFFGSLSGMLLASGGVIKTIENSQETTRQQAILSAKPLLDTSMYSGYSKKKLQESDGVIYNCFFSDRKIMVESPYFTLSYATLEDDTKALQVLRIKNIGLGAAVNIIPSLYMINEPEKRLETIEKEGLEDIYNSVNVDVVPELSLAKFSLGNDSSEYFIVINPKAHDAKSVHYILEFRYSDMYNKTYTQRQYLLIDSDGFRPLHISEQKEVDDQ